MMRILNRLDPKKKLKGKFATRQYVNFLDRIQALANAISIKFELLIM